MPSLKPRLKIHFLWLAVAVVMLALYLVRAFSDAGTDSLAYYKAGQAVLEGGDFFFKEEPPFKYLPFTALLFAPLSLQPFTAFKVVIALLAWSSWGVLYLWAIRRVGPYKALLVFVALARFHNNDAFYLQVNHVALAMLVFAWEFRRRLAWPAAAAAAVAASFKVTPLALFALPWLKGERKIALTWVGIFAGLSLVAAVVLPQGLAVYTDWVHHLHATSAYPASRNPHIQCVGSMIWYWTGAWLPKEALRPLLAALLAGALGAMTLPVRLARRSANIEEIAEMGFAASILVLTMFSPLAWHHTYVAALPSVVLLLERRKFRTVWIAFGLMTVLPAVLKAAGFRDLAYHGYWLVWGAAVIVIRIAVLQWRGLKHRPMVQERELAPVSDPALTPP